MTHNQIAYIQARQNYHLESAKQAETRRWNEVQEGLKRIDQELQKDLQRINERYQTKSLQLQEQELALRERIQEQQLINERSRLEIQREGNAIQSSTLKETIRSNLAREEEIHRSNVAHETLNTIELNAKLPQYAANVDSTRAQSDYTRANTSLTKLKRNSEATMPALHKSQTFSNYLNPFVNLSSSILRAIPLFK